MEKAVIRFRHQAGRDEPKSFVRQAARELQGVVATNVVRELVQGGLVSASEVQTIQDRVVGDLRRDAIVGRLAFEYGLPREAANFAILKGADALTSAAQVTEPGIITKVLRRMGGLLRNG